MKALIALTILVAVIAGCTEKYGQPLPGDLPRISVMSALTDQAFLNRGVILEGTILTQCQATGCWFFLKDDTGRILVDLAPSNFTLPTNKTGKRVTVKGILTAFEGQTKIIGKEVTIH